MREKEREIALFCEGKLCKEWQSEWKIYTKKKIIERNKIRKIKGKRKSDIKVEGLGGWKDKWKEKVGENVNVKRKKKYNLMMTIFYYLNLSKILHFFIFFKQKGRENINN